MINTNYQTSKPAFKASLSVSGLGEKEGKILQEIVKMLPSNEKYVVKVGIAKQDPGMIEFSKRSKIPVDYFVSSGMEDVLQQEDKRHNGIINHLGLHSHFPECPEVPFETPISVAKFINDEPFSEEQLQPGLHYFNSLPQKCAEPINILKTYFMHLLEPKK